jgi:hypothetical protein
MVRLQWFGFHVCPLCHYRLENLIFRRSANDRFFEGAREKIGIVGDRVAIILRDLLSHKLFRARPALGQRVLLWVESADE